MSLKTLKDYMEAGRYGSKLSLGELKELDPEERDYFDKELAKVEGVVFDMEEEA